MTVSRYDAGRRWIAIGAALGFLAVLIGAFGAHGLSDSGYLERMHEGEKDVEVAGFEITPAYKYLGDFRTGVRYHMFHAVAIVLLGLFANRFGTRLTNVAGTMFLLGSTLFSGSLYILVVCGTRWLGIRWGLVAPIGGTLQLLGWIVFTIAALKASPRGIDNAGV